MSPVGDIAATHKTLYRTVKIENVEMFYREAGSRDKPSVVLLHGFPTSSHMFRNLIPQLATNFHVIAPDYPGFGHSSMPSLKDFEYSFDHLAKIIEAFLDRVGVSKFSLYVQDYGAPIGYRIAAAHPDRVQALIVQNGNAYDEGLDNDFWKPFKEYWNGRPESAAAKLRPLLEIDATKWQYTNGARNVESLCPDTWMHDQTGLDRPGNKDIQMELFYSYGTNSPRYPQWQQYFREHQPPMLIVWGANDAIFPAEGAEPYKRDLKNLEFHLLDTGHFALEEDGQLIGELINKFLARNLS